MPENWTITGDHGNSRRELIESAVNTAIGMSLIERVEIGARVASSDDTTWFAYVCEMGSGGNGLITCPTKEKAVTLADDIYAAIQRELKRMPPYSRRKTITRAVDR